jgi:hypothetical protein
MYIRARKCILATFTMIYGTKYSFRWDLPGQLLQMDAILGQIFPWCLYQVGHFSHGTTTGTENTKTF